MGFGYKSSEHDDRMRFAQAVDALRTDVAIAGGHMAIDGATRAKYDALIKRFSADIRTKAEAETLSWRNAAEEAVNIRNTTMELLRGRSTPIGRAIAEKLKRHGKTLNELIAEKSVKLFGPSADFTRFDSQQRNRVFRQL